MEGEISKRRAKQEDLILDAKKFFNSYRKELGEAVRREEGVVKLDFSVLAAFSPTLAEQVLETPEETLALLEVALEESGLVTKPRIRLDEMPYSCHIPVRAIRAKQLDKLLWI